ncbi:hypothetical protein PV04_08722 [Phialophora macrospora]|uniref:Restriction endonuclease domain-containing protein n=1 Tax=Phialophora macrospora TaxID=1851006 RepID=A0A0D2F6Z7_9EURO|nr:hypothetical protein PV04_08722 [Phialophora macrospora]
MALSVTMDLIDESKTRSSRARDCDQQHALGGSDSDSSELQPRPSISPSGQSATSNELSPCEISVLHAKDYTPALQRVIQHIHGLSDGTTHIQHWQEFSLSADDFEILQELVARNEFGFQILRFDYSADEQIFILRMTPDVVHSVYRSELEFYLRTQLALIPTRNGVSPAAADFAAGVSCFGDGTFKYPSTRPGVQTYNSKSPDCWFGHESRYHPSFVIEVANSQSTKSLERLAEQYLLETNADVRTVVGIDLDYNDKTRATVSVWRPRLDNGGSVVGVMCESLDTRISGGQTNVDPDSGLRLSLEDFAFARESGVFDNLDEVHIFLSAQLLCNILEKAERLQRGMVNRESALNPLLATLQPNLSMATT